MVMGFLDTISSVGIVRLDDIERISDAKPNAHGVMLHVVKLRDGRTFETFEHENGGLLLRPAQLISAEPGSSVIWTDGSDDEPVPWRRPIVAWALCLDGEVRPVTAAGVNNASGGSTYVEAASGAIAAVGEWDEPQAFDSADEMVAYFKAKGHYSGDRRAG